MRRRRSDGTEVFRLIALPVVLAAVGGYFSLLAGAVAAVVLVAVLVIVWRSPLTARKRWGATVTALGIAGIALWAWVRPTPFWHEFSARVVQVVGPKFVSEVRYSFSGPRTAQGNLACTAERTQLWNSEDAARRAGAQSLYIYYNPAAPNENSDSLRPGWIGANARPISSRAYRDPAGEFEATLTTPGSFFFPTTVHLRAPWIKDWRPGQLVTLWQNPLDVKQVSIERQLTAGDPTRSLFYAGAALLCVGLVVSFSQRTWIDPSRARSRASAPVVAGARTCVTTSDRLLQIDWYQFEKVTERILAHLGYSVVRSGGAHPDGGVDLLARKAGLLTVVQCKFWRVYDIREQTLRELNGARFSRDFQADRAILFTIADCTSPAKDFARRNDIDIFDRERICDMIEQMGWQSFPELVDPNAKRCPKCESKMARRATAPKPFWSCTQYRCPGKIEA